jgi:hypothetical protein
MRIVIVGAEAVGSHLAAHIAVTGLELVEPGYHLPSEATGPWGAIGVILAAVAGWVLLQHARRRRRERRLED